MITVGAANDLRRRQQPFSSICRWDPTWRSRETFWLIRFRGEDRWNDQPPKRQPGDLFVLGGATAGAVIGGVIGSAVSLMVALLGIVVGGAVGAVSGSVLRSFVEKCRKRHENRGSN